MVATTYCVPGSEAAPAAIRKNGWSLAGWRASGSYCAMIKTEWNCLRTMAAGPRARPSREEEAGLVSCKLSPSPCSPIEADH